ncbi:hypothetical protein KM043_003947 [Ampulex compressa]|nr:hypothetical protein KM043_003947 [Ampulex compressa]
MMAVGARKSLSVSGDGGMEVGGEWAAAKRYGGHEEGRQRAKMFDERSILELRDSNVPQSRLRADRKAAYIKDQEEEESRGIAIGPAWGAKGIAGATGVGGRGDRVLPNSTAGLREIYTRPE